MNLPLATTQSGLALRGMRVAEYAMLRVNCLPTRLLLDLCPAPLAEAIEKRLAAECQASRLAPSLLDALERSVSLATDRGLRRELLGLRRDIFGARYRRPSQALLRWLQSTLPDDDLLDLIGWLAAADALNDATSEVARHTADGGDRLKQMLEQALAIPAFVHGLEAAAPRLADRLARSRTTARSKEQRRLQRSLYAYVSRASSKTSPFSTLTCSVPVRISTACDEPGLSDIGKAWRTGSSAALNRGFATALRTAIGERDPDLLGGLALHPDLASSAGRSFLEHGRLEIRRASMWLEQYSAPLPDELPLLACLAQLASPFSVAAATAALQSRGMEANEARRLVRRCVRRDVLRTPGGWNAHTRAPATTLAELLRQHQSGASSDVGLVSRTIETLVRMQAWADAYATAASDERRVIPQRIQAEFEAVYACWSQTSAPGLRTPVYEDGWITPPPSIPGNGLKSMIERVGRVVAGKIRIADEYAWLRDRFVAYYGHGGVCDDAAAFCHRAWVDMSKVHRKYPPATSREAARVTRLEPVDVQVPATLFLQVEGSDPSVLEDPDCRVVLNLAYNRIGWQTLRLTASAQSDHLQFATSVRSWLLEAMAPREPVGIHVSGTCNNLQAGDKVTRRTLELEQSAREGDLSLADIVIRHDPNTEMLDVTDRSETPLALTYLGSAVPMPAWGPRYIPILLSEPFAMGRPPAKRLFAPSDDFRPIVHQPRWEEDKVVLLRETWWIRSAYVAGLLAGMEAAAQVEGMCRLARANAMPLTVFATGQPASEFSNSVVSALMHRKPSVIDLRVAACVEELLAIASQSEWLVLRECLPALEQQWLTSEGDRFVSEFMLEVVLEGRIARDQPVQTNQ